MYIRTVCAPVRVVALLDGGDDDDGDDDDGEDDDGGDEQGRRR